MMIDRIYYTDDSMIEGPLEDAPATGIACIVSHRSGSRVIHHGKAYYLDTEDGWLVCDAIDGLIDQVLHYFGRIRKVYQGRGMVNDDFWKLYDRVKKENPS